MPGDTRLHPRLAEANRKEFNAEAVRDSTASVRWSGAEGLTKWQELIVPATRRGDNGKVYSHTLTFDTTRLILKLSKVEAFMRRIFNLFRSRRQRMEHDLARELSYHIDRRAADLTASGMSEPEARRQAAIEFGGVTQAEEEVREVWFWRWLHELGRDVRYGARALKNSPGFTATAVLSLALGIGANVAIFSILYALVLRSLPVADPQRLVVVTRNNASVPYPLYRHFRDNSRTMDGVIAFRTFPVRLTVGGEAERGTGVMVSGSYFDVLGVRPLLGSVLDDADDQTPGSGGWRGPVAVIGHGYWMRRFGGARDVIGKSIQINGSPFTIAGVAPPGFAGTEVGETPDVYAPIILQGTLMPGLSSALEQPQSNWIRIMCRLKPDVSVQRAEAELNALHQIYVQNMLRDPMLAKRGNEWRERQFAQRIALPPGNSGISGLRNQYAKPLWVLMTVMGLVLLIACANVANLLLSRAAARRREIAIRLGLGAPRSRLIAQLLTESLLLAVAGGAAGLLLARWMRDVLVGYLPPDRSLSVPLDTTALLFALALAGGSVLLFGVVPAFTSTKVDVADAMKGGDHAAGPGRLFFRKGLVAFQMSLSFILLAGAALFLRSLHGLNSVDVGFEREKILVASIDAPKAAFPRVLDEMRRLPGVVAAGFANAAPLSANTGWNVFVPGYVPKPVEPRDSPWVGFISPGYFAAMNTPLLAGRDFDERDAAPERDVMIVNETFAKHFFEGRNPVGQRIGTTRDVYNYEIVGVVKDSKYTGLREDKPVRMMYVPDRPGPWASSGVSVLHVRTAGDPGALTPAIRDALRRLDPGIVVFDVHTVAEQIDRATLKERLVGVTTTLFGVLALLLAAIGLYGVMSYGVQRRTREFGIRMAIGARAGSLVSLVVREALLMFIGGAAIGLIAMWALGRLVASILFGIEPNDPLSTIAAAVVLAIAALLAAWIPARRAARVDPTQALRCQ